MNIEETNSELITLLIDGELEPSKEKALYASLAENEELRAEMRDLLSIRDTVNYDMQGLAPTPEATRKVYAALGFSLPFGAALTGADAILKTGFWASFAGRFLLPLCTAIVSAGLTGLLIFNLSGDNKEKIMVNNSNKESIKNTINTNTIQNDKLKNNENSGSNLTNNNSIRSISGNNGKILKANKKLIPGNRDRVEIAANNFNNDSETGSQSGEHESLNRNSDNLIADHFNFGNLLDNPSRPVQSRDMTINKNIIPLFINFKPNLFLLNNSSLKYEIQLRGASSSLIYDINDPSQSNNLFNNIGGGFFLSFNENISLGVEYCSDVYGLQFYNIEGDKIYLDEMKVMLNTFSLSGKFRLPKKTDWLAGATPYLQLSIGANQLGLVSRTTLGLEFNTKSGLSYIFGFDGSALWYLNQGRTYSSGKYGITYGLIYRIN